jgi:hypothetical protein
MLKKYHVLVEEDLTDPDAVLIFDESGFPKKGDDSAGVAKQYCGSIGKVDNCQVGVFAAENKPVRRRSRRTRSALLTNRHFERLLLFLYIPGGSAMELDFHFFLEAGVVGL